MNIDFGANVDCDVGMKVNYIMTILDDAIDYMYDNVTVSAYVYGCVYADDNDGVYVYRYVCMHEPEIWD